MANSLYEIKSNEYVVIITLWDRSFSTFSKALKEVPEKHQQKKVLLMQSKEQDNEPLKIIIVFEF